MLNEIDMKSLWKDLDHVESDLQLEAKKLSMVQENMQDLKITLEEEDEK